MKKRRGKISDFLLFLLCVLGACLYSAWKEKKPAETPLIPYYYAENGRDIYYGTDHSSALMYTLAGIDAPYYEESLEGSSGRPFGKEARDFVREIIRSNDIYLEEISNHYVYVWKEKPMDSSDSVTIKNQMLNALMISHGLSEYFPSTVPSDGSINPVYEKVFLELQKEAQNKRIGLWSLPENSPEERAKAEARRIQEEKERAEEERRERIAEEKEKKKKQQEYLRKANSVVVTPKGKKYHYEWCRTVKGSYRVLTIKQARKKGYKPCGVCEPPDHEVTLKNSNIYWGDAVIRVYQGENQRILK